MTDCRKSFVVDCEYRGEWLESYCAFSEDEEAAYFEAEQYYASEGYDIKDCILYVVR
jgi:hypothetical protein